MKTIAALFLVTLIATSAFAGGPACKVIIDYARWETESTALAKLADMMGLPELASEAQATAVWARGGGWMGALAILDGPYGEQHTKEILDQSYLVCDWATQTRAWDDQLQIDASNWKAMVKTMRKWRDADFAMQKKIDESHFPKGYKIPKHTP